MIPNKSFDEYLTESFDHYLIELQLKPGAVCKSLDKIGDLAGQLVYIKKKTGNEIDVILADGTEASTTVSILNPDPKSIRPYDHNKDPKFDLSK
jgi:hypothetical protein